MTTLKLVYSNRKGETFEDGTTKSAREYFDFIVSGKSLRDLIEHPELDLIGTFGWSNNKTYEKKQIDEFLGHIKPELKSGRCCFYVCPECGDISCGAITAKIEVNENDVVWKDFGYENGDEEAGLIIYNHVGPFKFDKHEYITLFEELKESK
jgi:hypothetical protein